MNKMPFSFCIIVFFVLIHSPLNADTQEMTFELLIAANQANIEKINSLTGNLRWTSYGEYFGSDDNGKSFDCNFYSKGKKIRYDKMYEDGSDEFKKIYSPQKTLYCTLKSGLHQAYIEEPSNPDGIFEGECVDVKRLMQFWQATNSELLKAIEIKSVDKFIIDKENGKYKVTMPVRDGNEVYVLWFDSERGYNISREQYISKGKVVNEIHRDFQNIEGVWVLKALKNERFGIGPSSSKGIAEIKIDDIDINVDIPDKIFEMEGFELPPNTRVYDLVADITYRHNPSLKIDAIALEVSGNNATKELTGTSSQRSEKEVTQLSKKVKIDNNIDDNIDTEGRKNHDPVKPKEFSKYQLLAGVVIFAVVIVSMLWLIRKKLAG